MKVLTVGDDVSKNVLRALEELNNTSQVSSVVEVFPIQRLQVPEAPLLPASVKESAKIKFLKQDVFASKRNLSKVKRLEQGRVLQ